MKKISKLTVITTLITLLPIVLGIALYDRLPDVVATHWGIDNQPNGWSSKAMAAFGMPGKLAAIQHSHGDISGQPLCEGAPGQHKGRWRMGKGE